jgi:diguanylate cyclase (GGDEF)-like protein
MRQPPLQRRWIWIAAAIVLAALGTLGALFAARADRRNDRQQAHATFLASAAAVASSLTLAAQHEEDLVVAARGYLASDSHASELEFQRWGSLMDAFSRYPELEGGGEVILVTRSRLAAFAAKERGDPAITLPDGRPFHLLPPGLRPFYCLVALSLARKATVTTSGVDYCAQRGLRTAFLATRDSGRITYLPYGTGSTTALVIEAPIYKSGTVPSTLAERRQTFIGAFSVSFLPQRIVAEALRGHPGIVVEIAYDGSFTGVSFRSGRIARGDQTATVKLDDGWTMRVFGHPIGAGAIDDPDTLVVLVGGAALSVLLAMLVLVLGTGRARALAMVRDKTSELSHRALHDALTGLPNRTLVLDRGERMLARARRDPAIVPAALYLDVDRFKHVNDTFGHAAGDLLLQVVAARLREVIREEDTVGRLGGDEFVVLLASSTRERPAQLVAERLIEIMRQPLELTQGAPPFVPTVSVGIALGARASSEQLLRDADLALYTAKDSGKDRAVLFEASMQSAAWGRRELELDTAI